MDMEFEDMVSVSNDQYLEMIKKKTAVLLGFALQAGAHLAGAETDYQATMYQLGIDLGLSFQLMDDYLDAFGDPQKVGKKVGGDILEQKKTYMWNTLMSKLSESEQQQVLNNRSVLSEEDYVEHVKEQMIRLGVDKDTLDLARSKEAHAKILLQQLPTSDQKDYLKEIIDLLSTREY